MTSVLLAVIALGQTMPSVRDLFPTDLDTTWMYEKRTDVGGSANTYAITVTGKTDGQGGTLWEFSPSDSKRGSKTLYRVSDAGVYIAATGSPLTNLDPPVPILVGPLAKDKKWSYKGNLGIQGGAEMGKTESRLTGLEHQLVLGKDTECVRIESKTSIGRGKTEISVTRVSWYASGIGLVREVTTYEHDHQKVNESVTLTRFSKGGKP